MALFKKALEKKVREISEPIINSLTEENSRLRAEIAEIAGVYDDENIPDITINLKDAINVIRKTRALVAVGPKYMTYETSIYFLSELEHKLISAAREEEKTRGKKAKKRKEKK